MMHRIVTCMFWQQALQQQHAQLLTDSTKQTEALSITVKKYGDRIVTLESQLAGSQRSVTDMVRMDITRVLKTNTAIHCTEIRPRTRNTTTCTVVVYPL
jgi:hypothetical protein